MNAERRKAINTAISSLEEIKATIEELQNEEQDYYDNMPESFQSGEKGEKGEAAAGALQEAIDSVDSTIENLNTACEE